MEGQTIGNQEVRKTQALITRMLEFINRSPWKGERSARLERLLIRTEQPCELAIAGRVKAGKSSFLNALLGDDLALVGTSETTATINFFRYGVPQDPERPIRVIWEDGREEFHPRSFLDSLQGNSKEVLERAQGINRLEYFVPNEMLRNVTLVDTPGTDAIVDEHEERADDYFSKEKEVLRAKHSDQSKVLTERADAVVYITERVPTQSNKSFLTRYFGNEGHASSAMNAIGVMTKIDLMVSNTGEVMPADEVKQMSDRVAQALKDELNDVMPVSAGIYRAVNRLKESGQLETMWQQLKRIPDTFFKKLLANEQRFLTEEKIYAKRCDEAGIRMLSTEERAYLLGQLDWRVFMVVAEYLYRYPLDEAVERMISYSGMEQVREILEKHFFQRSRIIRCSAIVKELHRLLVEMERDELYYKRREMNNRDLFCDFINTHPQAHTAIAEELRRFVADNSITQQEVTDYQHEIEQLLRQVETLQMEFAQTTESNEALVLLHKCRNDFSVKELQELERLFGLYHHDGGEPLVGTRQRYWRSKEMTMRGDKDVMRVIELAIQAYGDL